MTITADAILTYILVAAGGFLVKVFLDWIKSAADDKADKAKKFEEQTLKNEIEKIVKETNEAFKKELLDDISRIQAEEKTNYDYWQKMYWDAVNRLTEVQKEFNLLKEQDILFYKYLLIDTCKEYIDNGKMTQYQFDRLTEGYKIYKALGGNHQGDLYYKRAVALPIIANEHDNEDKEMHSIFDYADQVKATGEKKNRDNQN